MTLHPSLKGMRIKSVLIACSLAGISILGGCASLGTKNLPPDTVTFLTTDYRFKSVMDSNDDVKGWARDAISVINELQYQLELERNK